MKISLGHPEVNPPDLITNRTLWTRPTIPGVKVVDIGKIARRRAGKRGLQTVSRDSLNSNVRQLRHLELPERKRAPGKMSLAPTVRLQAPEPFETEDSPVIGSSPQRITTDGSVPAWARTQTTRKPVSASATWQRSTNSGAAWRSSSVRLPQAPE